MKRLLFFVMVLVCAQWAQAVSVTHEQATTAARAWLGRGGMPGVSMGVATERAVAHTTSNGAVFYTVKATGGGTVFTTGDTDDEPIIGFTSSPADFSTIDPKSPLWVLLNRDVSAMKAEREAEVPTVRLSYLSRNAAARTRQDRWRELLEDGDDLLPRLSYAAPIKNVTGFGKDGLRVPALIQSKWSQGDVDGKACYNYYTPNGLTPSRFKPGDPDNAVCGCVATAMAQVMRYFKYPSESVTPVAHKCMWNDNYINLTMQGGVYDWDAMTLAPTGSLADENRQAIGKLTSDAGIAVWMMYGSDVSGAYGPEATTVLKQVFGYSGAVCLNGAERLFAAGSASRKATLARTMFANFDAGHPVLVGIPGHAVVADGYGYVNDVDYVHFNMGWAGAYDYWYNIPDLSEAGAKYTAIDCVTYNIFTNAPATTAVLSGRVTDDDAKALADVAVKVYAAGTKTLVADLKTSESGVWAAELVAGTYDVEAVSDGKLDTKSAITLSAPSTTSKMHVNCNVDMVALSTSAMGNNWGNDLMLMNPTARIVRGTETNLYSRLDKALDDVEDGDVVEILAPIEWRESAVLSHSVTLVATNDDATAAMVQRLSDAALTVTNGATLTLRNIVFTGSGKRVVDVASDSCLTLDGCVDFGLDSTVVAVRTASHTGLCLAGALTKGFAIECTATGDRLEQFGTYTCPDAAAQGCVASLVNIDDAYGEIRGKAADGMLTWAMVPVPFDEAVGYFVGADATTNTYARLDRLFEMYDIALTNDALAAGRELVIRQSGSLSRALTIGADVTLRGEDDVALTNLTGMAAGFVITNGTLTVRNLGFSNYTGNALFLVDGGNLDMSDVTCRAIYGTNKWSGAVTVLKGAAKIGDSLFDDCRATGKYSLSRTVNAYGGAAYLAPGARLDLTDGTVITNCYALNYAGAVYVAANATLGLSGNLVVEKNTSGTSQRTADDIYLVKAASGLSVTDSLSGSVGVRHGLTHERAGEDGDVFATALVAADATNAVYRAVFFNDTHANLATTVADDGVSLAWSDEKVGPQPVDDGAVRIVYANGDQVDYNTLEEAFLVVSGDATIVVRDGNQTIPVDLTVAHKIVLTSDLDLGLFDVTRTADASLVVTSSGNLTIADLTLVGGVEYAAPIVSVDGGSVVLADGAQISDNLGTESPTACAIAAKNGATVTMQSGASILNCTNDYDNAAWDCGLGAAISLENSTVYLTGGTIAGCSAAKGAGVFVGSHSTGYVSGDFRATDNVALDGTVHNLTVSDNSSLILTDVFSGAVGHTSGVVAPTNVFGRVDARMTGDWEKLANSASNFQNDVTGSYGVAVTNATTRETLLVWSKEIAKDGSFVRTVDGVETVYGCVGAIPQYTYTVYPIDIAFASVVRDDERSVWCLTLTNFVRGCHYSLYATNSLVGGFDVLDAAIAPVKSVQSPVDGPYTFEVPAKNAGPLYWKVLGEPGEVTP